MEGYFPTLQDGDGVPTGSYSGYYAPADNARSLREIKHVIANYRNKKVVNIPVKSITLDKTNLNLLTDMSDKLTVTVDPYISKHDLIWTSSNSSVAKVDGEGNVTGLSKGTAIITVSTKHGSMSASCIVTVEENEEIIFLDTNLEDHVRRYIDKYEGPILRSDVLSITDMYLRNSNITSIEGLQYFTNLLYLNISNNSIENIDPVANLTKLEKLYLSFNQIQDLEPLRELTNLEFLYCDYNLITNIEPLRGLTSLRNLNLRENFVTDISHIKEMIELEVLDLTNNSVTNIEALENMDKLRQGFLGNNRVRDLTPVKIRYNNSFFDFWTSSDDSVAKVDGNGKVTAISPGKATITVTTVDGAKTASCEVTVVKSYDIWEEVLTTELPEYTWTVKLNLPVDEDTVNNSTVYIIDQGNKILSFIDVSVENDEEFGYIRLNNNGNFEKGKSYWIVIEDDVREFNGLRLKKGLKIEFIVQP